MGASEGLNLGDLAHIGKRPAGGPGQGVQPSVSAVGAEVLI
jgi:hypothetical protein